MDISLQHIVEAHKRMLGVILQTPVYHSPILSAHTGAEVYFKCENLQVVGSFKIRGATNKVKTLSEAERKRGIITASAGNHAQGVAYISREVGVQATIVIPENAPLTKVENTRRMGAEVIIKGVDYDDSERIAHEIERETGKTFVSAFFDPEVIAGQATVGLEFMLAHPDLDILLVPAGGGGLIAGVARAAKYINPNIKIIGIQPERSKPWYEAFRQKKYVKVETFDSLADGLTGDIAPEMVDDFNQFVDDVVLVSEEGVERGIFWLLDKHHMVSEGSGVVGITAMLDGIVNVRGKKVGTIITGCNIDTDKLMGIVARQRARADA